MYLIRIVGVLLFSVCVNGITSKLEIPNKNCNGNNYNKYIQYLNKQIIITRLFVNTKLLI